MIQAFVLYYKIIVFHDKVLSNRHELYSGQRVFNDLSKWKVLAQNLTFNCDLDLRPTWTNVSKGTYTSDGERLCQIILKSINNCRSYDPDKFWRSDAHTRECMPIHQTVIVTPMSYSSQVGSTKKKTESLGRMALGHTEKWPTANSFNSGQPELAWVNSFAFSNTFNTLLWQHGSYCCVQGWHLRKKKNRCKKWTLYVYFLHNNPVF